ncbi:hypothetical protein [Lysinibacillus sp. Bpr_S20]|uniref:hypothetical protein n=1 Tax=Lysinibacillus sp. Bpr_S20 TaxID=2933964 RepID=UPI0020131FFE|nr:hypothetical protein [Lysinibacillus sp. Bpr_S20]MCL1699712.1 hypothetical protein [Lysinibacillus sp. Bpr_S20]
MSSTTTLIEDFNVFYRFENVWNGCNADEMNTLISPDKVVRWVGPGNDISDWGYEETCNGWVV